MGIFFWVLEAVLIGLKLAGVSTLGWLSTLLIPVGIVIGVALLALSGILAFIGLSK
jgi:hypothetical protein